MHPGIVEEPIGWVLLAYYHQIIRNCMIPSNCSTQLLIRDSDFTARAWSQRDFFRKISHLEGHTRPKNANAS